MAFGVHSEVGKLHKVMVHRPGLEHTRLTPSNAEELLFDDVLWVQPRQGRARHVLRGDARARGRGVPRRALLAEALAEAGREGVGRRPRPQRAPGRHRAPPRAAREWVESADAAEVADFLIGGITKADVERDVGLVWESADPTAHAAPAAAELPVPTRPVVLDLRRRDAQPDDEAGAQAGDDDHGGDLPLPSDVRGRGVPDLARRRPTRTGDGATSRVVTSSRSATAPS